MDGERRLELPTAAVKYDASCASSGTQQDNIRAVGSFEEGKPQQQREFPI